MYFARQASPVLSTILICFSWFIGVASALAQVPPKPIEPIGTPLPSISYPVTQEFDNQALSLHVKVQSLSNYDWPMMEPIVIVTVTNIGLTPMSKGRVVTAVSNGSQSLGTIAAQPPRLFLAPGESQMMLADLGQAQGLDNLPSTPAVFTLTWTVNGQALVTTPITITNWMPWFNHPTQLNANAGMTVSGTVVDEQGKPISAAVQVGVGALLRDGIIPVVSGTGNFSFFIPQSSNWVVTATKPGYRSAYAFLDTAQDTRNLQLVLYSQTGPQLRYKKALAAEAGNAFWQGTFSADESLVFLSPGMESWPTGPSAPTESNDKAMLYTTTGVKRWAAATSTDAWGSDISGDGKWAVYAGHAGAAPPGGGQSAQARIVLLDTTDGHTLWTQYMASFSTEYPDVPFGSMPADSQEVRFSPDAAHIAIGEGTGYLRVLNRSDGSELWKLFLKGPIRSIRMSADGETMYATSAARITTRVRIRDGTVVWSKITSSSWAHQTGLKESPDGTLLGVMSQEGIATVHDAKTGDVLWSWNFNSKGHWADFSADSKVFVVSTLGGTWGVVAKTGARIFVVDGTSGGGFAKGQSYFVLPSNAKTVGLYDAWGTMISNLIDGLDWSDPNYYLGWSSADGSRLVFAKTYATTTATPVLFFVQADTVATLSIRPGWNLAGNGSSSPLEVTPTFGDATQVRSVWKWIPSSGKWAFYAPSLVGQELADYATSKGYDALVTINPGEGFWIHANSTFTVQLPTGAAVASTTFQNMTSGWHLIATGDTLTPSGFNAALSATPPTPGAVPQNVTSLWAWDNAQSKWYFYAPILDAQGGTSLTDYVNKNGYLNFSSTSKTLGPGVGFWINKP